MTSLFLNSILIIPLLFLVIQSLGGFIRYKLINEDGDNYLLAMVKSIGYNLCCIALAIDIGLLSQYNNEVPKTTPPFGILMTFHILAYITSILDQIFYNYINTKIKNINVSYKRRCLKFVNFIIFSCFLIIGIFCIYSIYANT